MYLRILLSVNILGTIYLFLLQFGLRPVKALLPDNGHSLTWVMEGHKQKGARLRGVTGTALDDGQGPTTCSSDLFKHATCCVHDNY